MTGIDRLAGQNNNPDRMLGRLVNRGTTWSLQDAKNHFSAVVDAARAGQPQRVTRRSKPAVVVLRVEDYERLRRLQRANAPTFVDLLLAIPSVSDCRHGDRTRLDGGDSEHPAL